MVAENEQWFNNEGVHYGIYVLENYDYQFISQSKEILENGVTKHKIRLFEGDTSQGEAWVELKNVGQKTWKNGFVKLGTTSGYLGTTDKQSIFAAKTWQGKTRATWATSDVLPGQTYKFKMWLKAPTREEVPGLVLNSTYKEYFRPLAEFEEWMKDIGIYFEIELIPREVPGKIELVDRYYLNTSLDREEIIIKFDKSMLEAQFTNNALPSPQTACTIIPADSSQPAITVYSASMNNEKYLQLIVNKLQSGKQYQISCTGLKDFYNLNYTGTLNLTGGTYINQ